MNFSFLDKRSGQMKINRAIFITVFLVFFSHAFASEYRDKGYLYLSPIPGAEYVSPQTKFFLVRFEAISPYDITNLPTFIEVTGGASGTHPGQTRIATDDKTVIFEVSSSFSNDELVTVALTPTVDICAPGVVEPYQYQFMVTGPMPAPPPPMNRSGSGWSPGASVHLMRNTVPSAPVPGSSTTRPRQR